jgi:regulator of protease activity HflC (stomatin/prohibitin superfamily)
MDSILSAIGFLFPIVFGVVLATVVVKSCFFTTQQNTKRIVTRFGKVTKVCSPGLGFKLSFLDSVSKPISLRTSPLDFQEDSYTKQNTSVRIGGLVQFRVGPNDQDAQNAFFKLLDPAAQIKAHVSSAIRAQVPTMELDEIQKGQKVIADAITAELAETMQQYGYIIEAVLITKADPGAAIVQANDQKAASEQQKQTAKNLAEANYSQVTRAAEAEKDAAKSRGEGIAAELMAITEGRKQALEKLRTAAPNASDTELLAVAALQQYIDGLVKMASTASDGTKVIFVDGGATASHNLVQSLTQSFEAGKDSKTAA